jgi:hypothetical protein
MAKAMKKGGKGAAGQKIKAGPSGKMYGNQKVVAQKPGVTATTQSRGRTSYAK